MKKSQLVQIIKESLNESHKGTVAQKQFKMNYSQLGKNEKEWVDDEIDNQGLKDALEIAPATVNTYTPDWDD